jgi:hypothetical protein
MVRDLEIKPTTKRVAMSPIVAGIACGLCGARFDSSADGDRLMERHWKTHSRWDRFRYWFSAPYIRVGSWGIQGDFTGVILFHQKPDNPPRTVWSWIWHQSQKHARKTSR